ncbi:Hypothetical predicted protein [Mytilus galloprovincialis]|uniref:Uncharacterized protein n=1 Tax=Mytilus galloprovincialis TaxID=29158 RepID=A0A8B6BNT1_MYTGA|nr:Hypothetical predicted protein [Mytilus galloprovincialis]
MTKERMPMFQRKPIMHENDNKQERQHEDIKSQMETPMESISPSESWISKVRAANNPDDTFDLDPRRQPHSDNKDEEKSTRRNRGNIQNGDKFIRPENMNFRKDIDDKGGQDMGQSHGSNERQSHVVQSMSGAISPIIYETSGCPWINSGDNDRENEKANYHHHGNRKSRKQINVQLPDASMEEELEESSDVSQTTESDLELDFDDALLEEDIGHSTLQNYEDQTNQIIKKAEEDEKIDKIDDEKLKDSLEMKREMINENLNDVSEKQDRRRRRVRKEDRSEFDEMKDENYNTSVDKKERRRHRRRRHINSENLMEGDNEQNGYIDGSEDRKVRRHRRRKEKIEEEENDVSPELMTRQAYRKGRNEAKDEESLKDENYDAIVERKGRRKHRRRKIDNEKSGNISAEEERQMKEQRRRRKANDKRDVVVDENEEYRHDEEQHSRRRRRQKRVDDKKLVEGTPNDVEVDKRKDQRHSRHQRERQRRDEIVWDNDIEDKIKSRISELNDNKMKDRLTIYGNSDNESRRLNTSAERALLAYMYSDSETEAEDQFNEDENQIRDEDGHPIHPLDEKRNFTIDDGQEPLMANDFNKNKSDVDVLNDQENRNALKDHRDLDALKHPNNHDDMSAHDTFEKYGSMDEYKGVNNEDDKRTEIKMEDEESMIHVLRTQLREESMTNLKEPGETRKIKKMTRMLMF